MNIFEGFEGAKIFYTDRFDGNFADYVGDDPALVSASRGVIGKYSYFKTGARQYDTGV